MRLALALAVLPGLGTGLLLVLVAGARLPVTIAWPQLAQAHGQIQSMGFVLLFIIAVGLQLFPRFLGKPLHHAERAVSGSTVVALALVARFVGQPLGPGPVRVALLAVATIALPVGALVAGSAFHGLGRAGASGPTRASTLWRTFVLVGGLVLGAALGLCVWSGYELVSGAVVVQPRLDEALIHLELAGFPVCLVFAVASRVFGRFLLLRSHPALERRIPLLAGLWTVGLISITAGWLADAWWAASLRWLGSLVELGVAFAWVWLVGLYNVPLRESGTPYVTNPTRRWVRLAFVFLLLGLALNAALFGREAVSGLAASSTELSAARHALAQGFLLPLMVTMAARMLPVVSRDALTHRVRLETTLDLLFVGALLRVGAELVDGYGQLAGPLVALGGTLTVLAFCAFALAMWSSLGRLPHSPPRALTG